jgi:hypothetical protein
MTQIEAIIAHLNAQDKPNYATAAFFRANRLLGRSHFRALVTP